MDARGAEDGEDGEECHGGRVWRGWRHGAGEEVRGGGAVTGLPSQISGARADTVPQFDTRYFSKAQSQR